MKIYETLQQQYKKYGNVQNLMKFFTIEELTDSIHTLKNKSPGVDHITKYDYLDNMEYNIQLLYNSIRNGNYNPKPIRRCYIPKPNGKLRPLGIPSFEDKIVQCVISNILYSIYDQIFLDSSHAYCLKRNCHTALSLLKQTIEAGKTNYIVKTDIKGFFNNIDHRLLIDMLELIIKDKHFIKLISKFLEIEISDKCRIYINSVGTAQGCAISPILGNIYLHYALDLWFETEFKALYSDCVLIRYCDDFIACFSTKFAATQFIAAVKTRLEEYHLTLEDSKTDIFKFNINNITSDMFSFLGFNVSVDMNKQLCMCASYNKLMQNVHTISDKFVMMLDKGYSSVECIHSVNHKLNGLYSYFGVSTNNTWISELYVSTCKLVWDILYFNPVTRQMPIEQFGLLLMLLPISEPPMKLKQL